jgi:hypothetical protein
MRLGDALGFDDAALHDVYYESLLRYIGCNADTAWAASMVGDEIAVCTAMAAVDAGNPHAVVETVIGVRPTMRSPSNAPKPANTSPPTAPGRAALARFPGPRSRDSPRPIARREFRAARRCHIDSPNKYDPFDSA